MLINNAVITGSLTVNGTDVTYITGSSQISSSFLALSSSYLITSASYVVTSGSYAITSASFAQTSGSLSIRTGNLEATSSTLTSASSSFAAQSASLSTRLTTDETNITTLTNASASFAAQSASLSTRLTTDETNFSTTSGSLSTRVTNLEATSSTVSSSFASTSGSIAGRVTLIEGQYATTGSNNFTGPQFINQASNAISFTSTASLYTDGGLRVAKDSFVSGTAYFNNITVYGTSSIEYITSSQVNIGSNIITVNTDTPAIRFGGISVFDSGSTQLTGSLFWDSEKNHWIYSNPSGSAYNSAMLMNGPRNTGSLGTEQGTIANYIMKGQGGDHITGSTIYEDATGSVGIGTATPSQKLDVAGRFNASGGDYHSLVVSDGSAQLKLERTNSSTGVMYIGADNVGFKVFDSAFATRLIVSSTGAVTLGSTAGTGAGALYAGATTLTGALTGTTALLSTATSTTSQFRIENNSYAAGQTMGIDFTVDSGAKQAYIRAVVQNGTTAATDLVFGTASGGNNAATRLTIASTGAATFSSSVDATVANLSSGLKVTGSSLASGTGAEIVYSSGKGLFLTFNRSTSTYLPTEIDGSTVTLSISGTPKLTIASTGAATFSSTVTLVNDLTINAALTPIVFLNTTSTNKASGFITQESGTSKWAIGSNFGSGDGTFNLYNYGAAARYLTIASTGEATFSSSVTAGTGGYLINGDNHLKLNCTVSQNQQIQYQNNGTNKWQLYLNTSDNSFNFYNSTNSTSRLTILESGNVGIGTASPGNFKLYVNNGSSSNKAVKIDIGYGVGSADFGGLDISRSNTSTVGDGSSVVFSALRSDNAETEYGGYGCTIETNTAGSHAGRLQFMTSYGGTARIPRMFITGIGNVLIGTASDSGGYKLQVSGGIYATADITAYSDISVKENIRPIENVLARINNSRGVVYDRIDIKTKDNIGFIAQELEQQFPELISVNSDGTKGVKYQNAVAILFEAIKEQQLQIEELKTLIHGLTK